MSHLSEEQLETTPLDDAHVKVCADCARKVKLARGRQQMLKGLRDVTLTDAAFRRIEARLESDAREGRLAPRSPFRWWGLAVGAAVAAVLLFLVGQPSPQPDSRPQPLAGLPTPLPVPAQPPVFTVVRVEGSATFEGRPVLAGAVVEKPGVFEASRLLMRASGAGRLKVEVTGRFSLAQLGTVDEGRIAVDVERAEDISVSCAQQSFIARDAAFVLINEDGQPVLHVARGEVRTGAQTVRAPATWRLRDAGALESSVAFASAPPDDASVRFDVPAFDPNARFDIAGIHFGATPGSVLLPPGRHTWHLDEPGRPPRTGQVELIAGTPSTFTLPPLPAAEREIDPSPQQVAQLQRALQEQKPRLAECYEKWLKATPNAEGEAELTLTISGKGQVIAATVASESVPKGSKECFVRTAKKLSFPAVGGQVELAVPLVLKRR